MLVLPGPGLGLGLVLVPLLVPASMSVPFMPELREPGLLPSIRCMLVSGVGFMRGAVGAIDGSVVDIDGSIAVAPGAGVCPVRGCPVVVCPISERGLATGWVMPAPID